MANEKRGENHHVDRRVGDQKFAEICFAKYLSRKPGQSILSAVWTTEDAVNCPLISGSAQILTTRRENDTVRARFNNLAPGSYTVTVTATLQNPTEVITDYLILDVAVIPT